MLKPINSNNVTRATIDPKYSTGHMSAEEIQAYLENIVGYRILREFCTVENVHLDELVPDGSGNFRQETRPICNGNIIYSEAEIEQWPRLLVLNYGQASLPLTDPATTKINELPFQLNYRDKKLVLRAAILGSGSHFTSVIRMQHCWMHYDGFKYQNISNSTKFHAYKLNPKESKAAMRGRAISMIFYEVLDSSMFDEGKNPLFGDWNFDIGSVIAHRGCSNTIA